MEKFIHINNEFYSLKFGTKCLIQLNEFSKNISDQELIKLKFFLAIQHNGLNQQEALIIFNQLAADKGLDYLDGLLCEVLDLSIGDNNADFYLHIEELYRKCVGEMGIAPRIFYEMTPHEIDLAYQGYLDRVQLEANCNLIAIRKSKDSHAKLISLLEQPGWIETSNAEREQTFEALGIQKGDIIYERNKYGKCRSEHPF